MAHSTFVLLAISLMPMTAQTLSDKGLSETERSGLRLFLQRCSICHLGVSPRYQTFGPLLHKEVIAVRGDEAVRKKIMEGSQTMPGFQYILKPADLDHIVSYLKALPKETVTVAPTSQAKGPEEKN